MRHDGLGVPTGTIQYQVDGASLGNPVILVNAVAPSISTGILPAGTHTITAIYSGDATYTGFTQTLSETIAQAPLTITADSKSKIYGAANPTLTYTVYGLLNGDSPSLVSGVSLVDHDRAQRRRSELTPSSSTGGTAANYAITDVNGTLTVNKAPISLSLPTTPRSFMGLRFPV